MTTEHAKGLLAELAKYDTPTVCNVIELWNIRPRNTGYMNDTIRACFPNMPPMVGYALTSTFRSMAPPRGGDVYGSMSQQVEKFRAENGGNGEANNKHGKDGEPTILRVPVGTVRSRLNRARALLTAKMQADGRVHQRRSFVTAQGVKRCLA